MTRHYFEAVDSRIRDRILGALARKGDPVRAKGQQAYMKSDMPYYGVTVPEVRRIVRAAVSEFPLSTAEAWQATILLIWRKAKRREERYVAVELFNHPRYRCWLSPERIDLVEELVVTGAWWDMVDAIAGRGMGEMLTAHPGPTAHILRCWAADANLWKRRTAILAQLRRKSETDSHLLFEVIEPSIGRNEFFLRKGIGWALREYAKSDPDRVLDYVQENANRLSPLTKREALKTLLKNGRIRKIP